jgi:hypothetical protein
MEECGVTAINICRQADRVVMVTDGASWSAETGAIVSFANKTDVVPHLSAAFAIRGPTLAGPLFSHLLGREFENFDEMIAGIEDALPRMHGLCVPLFDGHEDIELAIAGWSAERNRAESYMMRTSQRVFGATPQEVASMVERGCYLPEPFTLVPFKGATAWAPQVSENARRVAGIYGVKPEAMGEDDLLRYMRTLLELQRHDLHRPEMGEPFSIVGGFATITTVHSDGTITQRVFHRWTEDCVGERIEPSKFVAPTVDMTGLSRVKRDMLERKARKLARAR